MRIVRIEIHHWRNFRNLQIDIPEDAPLICVVGENGTGKSNLFEFLAAVAVHFGMTTGSDIPRGEPFREPHSFRVDLKLSGLDTPEIKNQLNAYGESAKNWDHTLILESENDDTGHHADPTIRAGGIDDTNISSVLWQFGQNHLLQQRGVQLIYLDAERSFPYVEFEPYQYANALSSEFSDPDELKNLATVRSRQKFERWIMWMLAQNHHNLNDFSKRARIARKNGEPQPEFVDGLNDFGEAVAQILPHLEFAGVDPQKLTINFESAGETIPFSHLSGGEREVVFLVGQIMRFALQQGLLLIDEPELHLNPSLIRSLLAFLRTHVGAGQIWIATHSLEAVETAGVDATFLFERDPERRLVSSVSPLRDRPVVSSLSLSLGAPAFSLSDRRFIFVEAEDLLSERERFVRLCGNAESNRLINAGGCDQVIKKLKWIQSIADDSDEQLHFGGVIDRDFRTPRKISSLSTESRVHILLCHEVENFFLHPPALSELMRRAGKDPSVVSDLLVEAADTTAGKWILGRMEEVNADYCPKLKSINNEMRGFVKNLTWIDITGDLNGTASQFANLSEDASEADAFQKSFESAYRAFLRVRSSDDLWKHCMGKEVLNTLPREFGFTGSDVLERHVCQVWEEGVIPPPQELVELRNYVDSV